MRDFLIGIAIGLVLFVVFYSFLCWRNKINPITVLKPRRSPVRPEQPSEDQVYLYIDEHPMSQRKPLIERRVGTQAQAVERARGLGWPTVTVYRCDPVYVIGQWGEDEVKTYPNPHSPSRTHARRPYLSDD